MVRRLASFSPARRLFWLVQRPKQAWIRLERDVHECSSRRLNRQIRWHHRRQASTGCRLDMSHQASVKGQSCARKRESQTYLRDWLLASNFRGICLSASKGQLETEEALQFRNKQCQIWSSSCLPWSQWVLMTLSYSRAYTLGLKFCSHSSVGRSPAPSARNSTFRRHLKADANRYAAWVIELEKSSCASSAASLFGRPRSWYLIASTVWNR
ncbi:hypothetical protein SISSUDRAFT_819578 [Sistotremastrum suecicum HHB10207 ss-3]|uniref:Uncharacterized protein n=1 Tax=Sistotremastrum suecicum HHB10207 ss-3 TaxID=1314776 RepID=A0A166CSZ4_9AGAM|nr:hypothetical protein SISSUDRAFT_819578 [Sistotremastrum suecicum HHB10207 ss-3]